MFVKLENVASRLVNKRMKKHTWETADWETLIWQRKQRNSHFVRAYMYFLLVLVLSWVLQCCFSNKICWMLSSESKIINSVGPDKRRRLSPAERGWTFENIISLELHWKDKTFADKSRYIWNQWKFPAILLFFPTSVFRLQNMANFYIFLHSLLMANQIMVPFFNFCKKHSFSRKRYLFISF